MSDYLWDKQGEPDADIEELEQLLAPLQHQPVAFLPPARARLRRPWMLGSGAAAVAAIALAIVLLRPKPPAQAGMIVNVHGQGAKVNEQAISGDAKLTVGAWLDTGTSSVTLTVERIGSVEIAAGSRLRIVDISAQRQTLELDHGKIVAQIDAPPRSFAVQTKHATFTDLGCAFELRVDATGEGRLVVTQGSVALGDEHGEVAVPAGSECGVGDRGPGVPFSSDVSDAFREAMLRYPHDHAALAKILAEARPKDRDALDRMSAVLDAQERIVLEHRIGELRGDAPKPIEKTTTPAPHSEHLREHKRATKIPSHETKAASHVVTGSSTKTATPASKKTTTPASNDRLQHDPFRSTPIE